MTGFANDFLYFLGSFNWLQTQLSVASLYKISLSFLTTSFIGDELPVLACFSAVGGEIWLFTLVF